MAKRIPPTHPRAQRQIEALGQRLRAARLRRSMTQEGLAERVGVSVPTIAKLENGDPSTSLATVLRALTVLGLADDIDLIAAQDSLGRELQDSALRRTNAAPHPASKRGGFGQRVLAKVPVVVVPTTRLPPSKQALPAGDPLLTVSARPVPPPPPPPPPPPTAHPAPGAPPARPMSRKT